MKIDKNPLDFSNNQCQNMYMSNPFFSQPNFQTQNDQRISMQNNSSDLLLQNMMKMQMFKQNPLPDVNLWKNPFDNTLDNNSMLNMRFINNT